MSCADIFLEIQPVASNLFGKALIAFLLTDMCFAQGLPAKSFRLVVPFPAGGGADVKARILAPALSEALNQAVIVENRPGGGTLVAAEYVSRSTLDGQLILLAYPSFVIAPILRSIVSPHPLKDFKAVGQTISLPMGIVVHPSIPAKTLTDLIALARYKPNELNYGAASGSIHFVLGEMLRISTKSGITAIPYQGSAQFFPAVVGGHISMVISNVSEFAPLAQTGKVRPIVVTSATRVSSFPNVQTAREAGYPQIEAENWGGIVVASATSPDTVNRLNAALTRALIHPDTSEKLISQNMNPAPSSVEKFQSLLQTEHARYAAVIAQTGIKAD